MAHHASAIKHMRQTLKRRAQNRRNLSGLKTHLRRLREAIAQGDGETARKILPGTVAEIDRAAKKGVIHDNAAARHKSRLSHKVNALGSAS